ncbi:MAG: prepilin-type N-terminal cleavage/methylation domain-containing protein, partial [Gemmatimonadaceae bacterium]
MSRNKKGFTLIELL